MSRELGLVPHLSHGVAPYIRLKDYYDLESE